MLALNVNMRGKRAVVVGGGAVALRKVQTILAAEGAVTVVSPALCPLLEALSGSGEVDVRIGTYDSSDLDGAFLAVAATDNEQVNRQVAADAGKRRILISVADQPASGDCIFPATVRRGRLEIAVSTGGQCPSLAAEVKRLIEGVIGDEYAEILEQLAVEREKLLTDGNSSTYNAEVLRSHARQLIAEHTDRKEPP